MIITSRRGFLSQTLAGAACLGIAPWGLPHVSADDARLEEGALRPDAEIESLARLMVETRRDRVLEEVGRRILGGVTYREVVTALFLAGLRNIRPQGGDSFHAVLVIHSAYEAGLAASDEDRWLPICWAIDEFKRAQEIERFILEPLNEARVPGADSAREAFDDAISRGDIESIESAVVGCVRGEHIDFLFDRFAMHAARDFGSLGHQVIFVGQAWRALETIGARHAEPLLRSLTRVVFTGFGLPPLWEANRDRAQSLAIPAESDPDAEATLDLLDVMRQASPEAVSRRVAQLVEQRVTPQSIWDAAFAGAAELLMRQPAQANDWFQGIFSLHAVTSMNAMHFAYANAQSEGTRLFLLLQSPAIVPMFLDSMRQRGGAVSARRIDEMDPAPLAGPPRDAIDAIFDDIGMDRTLAACKTLTLLQESDSTDELMSRIRTLLSLKANDTHDYKFSTAMFEDYEHVSPTWRDRYLASGMHIFRGASDQDNPIVERIHAALMTKTPT